MEQEQLPPAELLEDDDGLDNLLEMLPDDLHGEQQGWAPHAAPAAAAAPPGGPPARQLPPGWPAAGPR